jgi:hypothetical protein
MIPLVYRYLRITDDIVHPSAEAYSPGDRDHTQDFRNGLTQRLAQSGDREADNVLQELAVEPNLVHLRDWILNLLDKRREQQADSSPWTTQDVRDFTKDYDVEPKTDEDLFNIACRGLSDSKHDVEKSDNSLRENLRRGDDEYHLRRWVASELQRRSRKHYTVPQEEEIDLEQRPDIRIEHPGIAPISVEIKWADSWSLDVLLERLENQLVGQYLRARGNRYGIYLLGYIQNQKYWQNPTGQGRLGFDEVLQALTERANAIVSARTDVAAITVIGIDFCDPRGR